MMNNLSSVIVFSINKLHNTSHYIIIVLFAKKQPIGSVIDFENNINATTY